MYMEYKLNNKRITKTTCLISESIEKHLSFDFTSLICIFPSPSPSSTKKYMDDFQIDTFITRVFNNEIRIVSDIFLLHKTNLK